MTRRVCIIVGDGYDAVAYNAVRAAVGAGMAVPFVISPKRQKVYADGEEKGGAGGVQPDHNLEGQRSTMFDTIFIPGGSHVKALMKNGRAIHYIREAFGHLKAIGATGEAVELVKMACGVEGMEFAKTGSANVVDSYGVVTIGESKPNSFKDTLNMAKGATNFIDAYTYAISLHKNFDREMDGLSSMVAY